MLQDPTNTLFVVPTRTYQLGMMGNNMYNTCSADGHPRGSAATYPLSCIRSTRNRNLTGGFFDGHVKNVNGVSTVLKNMWGIEGFWDALLHTTGSAEADAIPTRKIKEWSTGL